MEYEDVLVQGDERAAGASYRLFDEHGQVLALRSDMTIPIARLVATRFARRRAAAALLLPVARLPAVRPQRGQQREFLQAGIELIGAPAPGGHGRGDRGPVRRARRGRPAARARRPRRRRASTAGCWRASARAERAAPVMQALERHDFVELERRVGELGVCASEQEVLLALPAAARRARGDRPGGRARRRPGRQRGRAPARGRGRHRRARPRSTA